MDAFDASEMLEEQERLLKIAQLANSCYGAPLCASSAAAPAPASSSASAAPRSAPPRPAAGEFQRALASRSSPRAATTAAVLEAAREEGEERWLELVGNPFSTPLRGVTPVREFRVPIAAPPERRSPELPTAAAARPPRIPNAHRVGGGGVPRRHTYPAPASFDAPAAPAEVSAFPSRRTPFTVRPESRGVLVSHRSTNLSEGYRDRQRDGVPLVFSNSSPRLRAVNKLPPAWGVGAGDALAAAAVAARSAAGDAHLSRGAALPLPQLTNNCGNSWGVSAPPKTWSPDGAAARAAAALARAGIDPFGEADGRRVVVVNGQAGEFALPKGVSPLPPPRHEDRSEAAAAAGWAAAAAAAGMPQPRGGGRTAGGHQQNRRVGAAAPAASWEVRPRWPQPNASHAPVRGVTAQLNPKSARGDGGSEHVPKALLQAPARRRKGKGKAKGGGGGKLSARVHRPPMPAHAVSAWHSAQGESA